MQLRRVFVPRGLSVMLAGGEVAERSKAAVLKTVVGQPTGGSNPSLSANILNEIAMLS